MSNFKVLVVATASSASSLHSSDCTDCLSWQQSSRLSKPYLHRTSGCCCFMRRAKKVPKVRGNMLCIPMTCDDLMRLVSIHVCLQTTSKQDDCQDSLYDSYKDPADDCIGPEGAIHSACAVHQHDVGICLSSLGAGVEKLCKDMQVDPADRKVRVNVNCCTAFSKTQTHEKFSGSLAGLENGSTTYGILLQNWVSTRYKKPVLQFLSWQHVNCLLSNTSLRLEGVKLTHYVDKMCIWEWSESIGILVNKTRWVCSHTIWCTAGLRALSAHDIASLKAGLTQVAIRVDNDTDAFQDFYQFAFKFCLTVSFLTASRLCAQRSSIQPSCAPCWICRQLAVD